MGPNTGGMGCATFGDSLPTWLTRKVCEQAYKLNERVVECLKFEFNMKWSGVLFGGFMITEEGLKLLEYNVRFGDPEAIGVLNSINVDILDLFLKATLGIYLFFFFALSLLPEMIPTSNLEISSEYPSCTVYVVPANYPNPTNTIHFNRSGIDTACKQANLIMTDACINGDRTTNSRSFAITAIGIDNIKILPTFFLENVQNVLGDTDFRWRHDIWDVFFNKDKNDNDVYAKAGVNIVAGNNAVSSIQDLVRSTFTAGVLDFPGGFGGVFGVGDVLLVASTDSVGSKSVFNDKIFSHHESLFNSGVSIVNHCINDIGF